MFELSNTNPDFYRMRVRESDDRSAYPERAVIYATSDGFLVGKQAGTSEFIEQVPDDANLTVSALEVTLIGTITVPRADVRILCRTLRVRAQAAAVIDVSGASLPAGYDSPFPTQPLLAQNIPPLSGAHGKDVAAALAAGNGAQFGATAGARYRYGEAGKAGGSITILCDELSLDDTLTLRANGGAGFPGCSGQQGGPHTDAAQPGGRGGDGGSGGAGGDGGSIVVRYRKAKDLSRIVLEAEAGAPGTPGERGHGGGSAAKGPSGNAAPPVTPAADGKTEQLPVDDISCLGAECDEVFLLKAAQRAKLLYLAEQPASFAEDPDTAGKLSPEWRSLGSLLRWLREVLAPYSEIDVDANPPPPLADLRKSNLYVMVAKLAIQHLHGYTYFGEPANTVPALRLEAMDSAYDSAKASRAALEESFLAMSVQFADAEQAQKALDANRVQLKAALAAYKESYQAIVKTLTAPDGIVKTLDAALGQAIRGRAHLQELIHPGTKSDHSDESKLARAIREHFDCNVASILDTAQSFAFTGGEGAAAAMMGGVSVLKTVYDGVNKITDDNGKAIDKKYLYSRIAELQDSDDFAQGVRGSFYTKDADGHWQPGKAATLLLMSLDKFSRQISDLKGALGDELSSEVMGAVGAYKAALYEKGRVEMLYNVSAAQAQEDFAKYAEAQRQLDASNAKANPVDPHWAALVAHYQMLYQEMLDDAIEAVARLKRKHAYLTLAAQAKITNAKLLTGLWSERGAPTAQDVKDFEAQVIGMRRDLLEYYEQGSSAKGRIPADPAKRGTLFASITDPAALRAFAASGSITVQTVPAGAIGRYRTKAPGVPTIPPVSASGAYLCEVADSARFYDIRVSKVQPRVFGASCHSGLVELDIRASVETGIEDAMGTMLRFSHHHPRNTSFTHHVNTSPEGTLNDDLGEGMDGPLSDEYLDAVGVYGTWTLRVSPAVTKDDPNFGLALDNISGVRIYFHAFAKERPSFMARRASEIAALAED